MRWTPGGTSEDIEDRRDASGSVGGGGGFGGGLRLGLGGTVVVLLLSFIFGTDFFALLSGGGPAEVAPAPRSAPNPARTAKEQTTVQFVSFVLDDVQRTWDRILPEQANRPYRHSKLVLFRDAYPSACGHADSATGPFFCPGDEKVYIDLSFFDELKNRFGASGEFAQAYVLAHEIGHHVQKVLGIEAKVRQLQSRNPGAANNLSVRLELQADCFAGVWGHSTAQRKIIDERDIEDGLRAAAAVGDDHIQKMSNRRVSPESFTHGSSAQRTEWFRRGLSSGNVQACNTFESR
ncbi:MAG TPA: neutral zinc metallopeptidase [Bryobacteraceae bacterium]|nr:neutral zinc metallopeptidase [Bryobacteraceae bacterium]